MKIYITEQRIKKLIAMELEEYLKLIAKATAEAIYQNNRKIEQDLRNSGVIKG